MTLQTTPVQMQMQTVLQISITTEQLRELIKDAVDEAIARHKKAEEKEPPYYTRKEVAAILKVSSATIRNYERKGIIQRLDLRGSTTARYASHDVLKIKAITNK